MKILNVDRQSFYSLANVAFAALEIKPIAMELGVYDGKNARSIYDTIAPKFMYLVDAWQASLLPRSYYPFEPAPAWVERLQADLYTRYYGGDAENQQTFEALFQKTQEKFYNAPNVKIIRADSLNAHKDLGDHLQGGKLDFLYIDGNHQYEYVFNDLMTYADYCSENAILQMNDCCFSHAGNKQNLGVLEACTKFIKVSQWRPIAINLRNWSDLVMAKKDSPIGKIVDSLLSKSNVPFVEVPDSMLGGSRILENSSNVISMSFL